MKELSISKSILSISSPGVSLQPGEAAAALELARKCNDFARELVVRRPHQFDFWASLPLPDVPGSLAEISYALDTLHPAGFALKTNYHGLYLGDVAFDAVFEKLNEEKATVFIHPTTPCIRHKHGNECTSVTILEQYPNPMFEFMFDTARALINLFVSGTISRCPNITFVIPHASGALPPLVQRFCWINNMMLNTDMQLSSQIVKETFKRQFYFDLAGFPFPDQIHGILRFVGPEKLLYGTDFPFTPAKGCEGLAVMMKSGLEELFPDADIREAIYSGNAKRLFLKY